MFECCVHLAKSFSVEKYCNFSTTQFSFDNFCFVKIKRKKPNKKSSSILNATDDLNKWNIKLWSLDVSCCSIKYFFLKIISICYVVVNWLKLWTNLLHLESCLKLSVLQFYPNFNQLTSSAMDDLSMVFKCWIYDLHN